MEIMYNGKRVHIVVLNTAIAGPIFIDQLSDTSLNMLSPTGKAYAFVNDLNNNENLLKGIENGLLLPYDNHGKIMIHVSDPFYSDITNIMKDRNKKILKKEEEEKAVTNKDAKPSLPIEIRKLAKSVIKKITPKKAKAIINSIDDVSILKEMVKLETRGKKRNYVLKYLLKQIKHLQTDKKRKPLEVYSEPSEEILIK